MRWTSQNAPYRKLVNSASSGPIGSHCPAVWESASDLGDGVPLMGSKRLKHHLSVGVGLNLHVLTFYLLGAPQIVKRLVRNDVYEAFVLRLQP